MKVVPYDQGFRLVQIRESQVISKVFKTGNPNFLGFVKMAHGALQLTFKTLLI